MSSIRIVENHGIWNDKSQTDRYDRVQTLPETVHDKLTTDRVLRMSKGKVVTIDQRIEKEKRENAHSENVIHAIEPAHRQDPTAILASLKPHDPSS